MYNGFKNYETWNVVLWIDNDEGLYSIAKSCRTYTEFVEEMRELGSIETGDSVAWNDSGLDIQKLNDIFEERWNE
jgi:hypothetical protein